MGLLGGSKIRVDAQLYSQLSRAAEERGYSSVDEMAEHILRESLLEGSVSEPTREDRKLAEDQLRGLGYLK